MTVALQTLKGSRALRFPSHLAFIIAAFRSTVLVEWEMRSWVFWM